LANVWPFSFSEISSLASLNGIGLGELKMSLLFLYYYEFELLTSVVFCRYC
jgi:hypothetical protein